MTDIKANPEVVVAILQERSNNDPFIREVLRGAILEAALMAATEAQDTDDS